MNVSCQARSDADVTGLPKLWKLPILKHGDAADSRADTRPDLRRRERERESTSIAGRIVSFGPRGDTGIDIG